MAETFRIQILGPDFKVPCRLWYVGMPAGITGVFRRSLGFDGIHMTPIWGSKPGPNHNGGLLKEMVCLRWVSKEVSTGIGIFSIFISCSCGTPIMLLF